MTRIDHASTESQPLPHTPESGERPRILYAAREDATNRDLPTVFRQAIEEVGDLTVRVSSQLKDAELATLMRDHDVYLICRHSARVPDAVGNSPGRLRLIQAVIGSLQAYVPRAVIEAGVPTANWGEAPADEIAEGTLALLLATLTDLHHHVMTKRRGGWKIDGNHHGGKLTGAPVGLYGFGFIARRFAELLAPFRPEIHVYDPYVEELPGGMRRAPRLASLFDECHIISVHAGLTPETRGSVNAELLSRLPDHGVIINTGRGAIIDQPALFAELESERLRAGLDVLDEPDTLEPEHPARTWENLILTAHQVHLDWPRDGAPPKSLTKAQSYAVENLHALLKNGEIRRRVYTQTFNRMT